MLRLIKLRGSRCLYNDLNNSDFHTMDLLVETDSNVATDVNNADVVSTLIKRIKLLGSTD
jgi:vesicle coat complex subunit